MIFYFQFPANYFPLWFPLVGSGTPPVPAPASPINPPGPRTSRQVQFPKSCCEPRPCYVADYTYTARNGDATATVTRQCHSPISQAHARNLARLKAIAEAKAEVGLL